MRRSDAAGKFQTRKRSAVFKRRSRQRQRAAAVFAESHFRKACAVLEGAVAYHGHVSAYVNALHSRTRECARAYFGYAVVQRHFREACAICKHTDGDDGHGVGYDDLCHARARKGIVACGHALLDDILARCGRGNVKDLRSVVIEQLSRGAQPVSGVAVGDGQRLQIVAVKEHACAHVYNRIGNVNLGQSGAALESIVADCVDA